MVNKEKCRVELLNRWVQHIEEGMTMETALIRAVHEFKSSLKIPKLRLVVDNDRRMK